MFPKKSVLIEKSYGRDRGRRLGTSSAALRLRRRFVKPSYIDLMSDEPEQSGDDEEPSPLDEPADDEPDSPWST